MKITPEQKKTFNSFLYSKGYWTQLELGETRFEEAIFHELI
jgi:hypothetical protein